MVSKVFSGSSGGSDGKDSACNAGDSGSFTGLGRSLGEEDGYPLQYSREFHGQRSLAGYSPWGHKELNTTECMRAGTHTHTILSLSVITQPICLCVNINIKIHITHIYIYF